MPSSVRLPAAVIGLYPGTRQSVHLCDIQQRGVSGRPLRSRQITRAWSPPLMTSWPSVMDRLFSAELVDHHGATFGRGRWQGIRDLQIDGRAGAARCHPERAPHPDPAVCSAGVGPPGTATTNEAEPGARNPAMVEAGSGSGPVPT